MLLLFLQSSHFLRIPDRVSQELVLPLLATLVQSPLSDLRLVFPDPALFFGRSPAVAAAPSGGDGGGADAAAPAVDPQPPVLFDPEVRPKKQLAL